ncbi:FAS1-like dehydratase domain-containing protein [Nocardia crassostreae]|uniref:FAS1-like dehydratase domain-containing protein n=1 Tax=Nocardia crassostreae TaxID=53428 RepID=UPI0009FBFFB5|nr:MaoC family dehydratase N-terminal domain-containing protein [Nocardia crassostreae]
MVAVENAHCDDLLEPPTAAVPDIDERLVELRSMVGRNYRLRDDYEVGREQVRAFARAVQNDHPAHFTETAAADLGCRGVLAPPTFAALLAGATQQALAGLLTGCDLTTAVQTQQVMDYYRPIVVCDRLTSTVAVQSHREAFGGDLLVVTNTITDQDDEIVLVGNTSIIARTGAAELGLRLAELNADVLRHDVLTIAPRPSTRSRAMPKRLSSSSSRCAAAAATAWPSAIRCRRTATGSPWAISCTTPVSPGIPIRSTGSSPPARSSASAPASSPTAC